MHFPLLPIILILALCLFAGIFGDLIWGNGAGITGDHERDTDPIQLSFSPGEISDRINTSIRETRQGLDEISVSTDLNRTVQNTLIRFEDLITTFDDQTRVFTLISTEFPDPAIASEAGHARYLRDSFLNEVYLRPELADALARVHPDNDTDRMLQSRILNKFRYASLSPSLQKNLTRLGENLSVFESEYLMNQQNGSASANLALLPHIISARQEIVSLLGYPSFADYQIAESGLKANRSDIETFLLNRSVPLSLASHKEAAQLLTVKKQTVPQATHIYDYEIAPLRAHLTGGSGTMNASDFVSLFPVEQVIERAHGILSGLLGIQIREVPSSHTDVSGIHRYQISVLNTTKIHAWFYLWFRDDEKGGTSGRTYLLKAGHWKDGVWIPPVSFVIIPVSPSGSLGVQYFTPGDLQVLFHEYGHLFRQSLVTGRYATLSEQDPSGYTEVPSLLFERIIRDPQVLHMLAGSGLSPLSSQSWEQVRDQIVTTRGEEAEYGPGYIRMYQILLSLIDLSLSSANPDPDFLSLFNDQYFRYTGYTAVGSGSSLLLNPAFFLSDNAGTYWHYVLDDAYAEELFTRLSRDGVLNQSTGITLRKEYFEPAGSADPALLMQNFLGRELSISLPDKTSPFTFESQVTVISRVH